MVEIKISKIKNFKKNKKSMLFTLGSFIMTILVLLLALLIFNTSQQSSERFSEFAISDRLFDLFSSVENGIIKILSTYSDVNVSIEKKADGTDVSFTETITREKEAWGEEFSEKIDLFKSYVESKDSHILIHTDALKDKELPFIILPHNIEYSRSWKIGHVTLNVVPKTTADNFNSYDVLVNTGNVEIDKVTSQFGKTGSFSFKVKAIDNFGHSFTESSLIDPEKQHQVQVFLIGGNKVKITLDNRELETWTNSPEPMQITTTIDELEKMDEEVRVKYATNIIYVNFSEFDLTKESSISIS